MSSTIIDICASAGMTVAAAESLTGGALGSAIVAIPGASAVYRGGVCVYATDTKATVLGVDEKLLADQGPVHPDVAVQMAQSVRQLFRSDIGLATTGVAGPGSADGHPAGTVFIAIATEERGYVVALNLSGNRDEIRGQTVQACLKLLKTWCQSHTASGEETT